MDENISIDEPKVLTVGQINEYLKAVMDSDPILYGVYIKGEISNFTFHYKTGHLYFTLKDNDGTIKSVMFKNNAGKLKFNLENGMKVIAHGRISVFVRDGQYIFYIDDIEPDGIGALYIAFEQLKNRLDSEGLFRDDKKKPLPKIPLKIGIITSPTGAAIRDMINIIGRRFPFAEIILYPALVQGNDAPPQLIEGIRYFNETKTHSVNVIVIGRGGGSIEDLWAFNNEELARAIFKSKLPVISAVGHEIDFTICDFVSDKRAPTPSAAAELAVPDTVELKQKFLNIITRMETLIIHKIKINKQHIERIKNNRVFLSPKNVIDDRRMTVLSLSQQLESFMKLILQAKRGNYERGAVQLAALNPLAIISRGYSAVFKSDGVLIKTVEQVSIGDEISIKTSNGNIIGEVKGINKNE